MAEAVSRAGASARQRPGYALLLLAGIALVWGLNWPAMKVVLAELPILVFRTICLYIAGPALLALSVVGGTRIRLPRRELVPLCLAAFFNITCWNVLTALGLTLIGAGRASLIAFTMPVWATFLAAWVLHERLTAAKLAGLGFALAGLALLLAPQAGNLGESPWGAVAVFGAALSWACGTIVMKNTRWSIPATQLTGWQLLIGGIPIVIAALIIDDFGTVLEMSTKTVLVIGYVLVLPMIFAQWAWFRVLALLPASVASFGTLAVPVVGLLSSAILLGEKLGWTEGLALVLIVLALTLVLLTPARNA